MSILVMQPLNHVFGTAKIFICFHSPKFPIKVHSNTLSVIVLIYLDNCFAVHIEWPWPPVNDHL